MTTKQFSALAGGLALAILILPMVTPTPKSAEAVPESLREAARASAAQVRAHVAVMLRTALPGIAVGVMLSVRCVAGERRNSSLRRSITALVDRGNGSKKLRCREHLHLRCVSYEAWQQAGVGGGVVLLARF